MTKNFYAARLKRRGTIHYFKSLAQESGVPYQTLINLYLRECAASKKKLSLQWKPA